MAADVIFSLFINPISYDDTVQFYCENSQFCSMIASNYL